MVIVFGQKKGGCYKSMTSLGLAGVLANRGKRVIVVDADTNETSNSFLRRRNEYNSKLPDEKRLPFIKSELKRPEDRISDDLQDLDKNYDYVIVDTGGYENLAFKTSLHVADIIYLPFQPCYADIEQLAPTVKVIKETEDFVSRLIPGFEIDARLIVTGVDQHSRDRMVEARELSKDLLSWCSISNVTIGVVKAVRDGQQDGKTLSDVKHPKRAMYELLLEEIEGKRELFCKRQKA